jgi:hypothetical protein
MFVPRVRIVPTTVPQPTDISSVFSWVLRNNFCPTKKGLWSGSKHWDWIQIVMMSKGRHGCDLLLDSSRFYKLCLWKTVLIK